jgi:hypothetical protein
VSKSFSTANRNAPEPAFDAEPLTFQVDGEDWTATPPTGGQMALVMAAQAEHTSPVEQIRGLIDFLDSVLDENAQARYRERLMDRNDPFDIADVEGIIEWLMEEWSALPPTQPRDYLPSRKSTGAASTAKRPSRARATS